MSTMTRFATLSASDVDSINIASIGPKDAPPTTITIGPYTITLGWFGFEEYSDLVGLEPIDDEKAEGFRFKIDSNWFTMRCNSHNRTLQEAAVKKLERIYDSGKCVAVEPWLKTASGIAASLQHRGVAAARWYKRNPGGKLPIFLIEGMPDEFIDTIDTGRSRTNKDTLHLHDDIFDAISTPQGESYGDKHPLVRKQLVADLQGAQRSMWLRNRGVGLKGSGQFGQSDSALMISSHPMLEELVLETYHADCAEGTTSTWGKQAHHGGLGMTRAHVAAALYLYASREVTPQHDLTDPDAPTILFTDVDNIDIDKDCKPFLRALSGFKTEGSPLYVWANGRKGAPGMMGRSKGKSKEDPSYRFGALVQAIIDFYAGQYDEENPIVYRAARFPSYGAIFGGFDCGPVAKPTKSKAE